MRDIYAYSDLRIIIWRKGYHPRVILQVDARLFRRTCLSAHLLADIGIFAFEERTCSTFIFSNVAHALPQRRQIFLNPVAFDFGCQNRRALAEHFAIRRNNGVDQPQVINLAAIRNSRHIARHCNRRHRGDRLANRRHDRFRTAPLNFVQHDVRITGYNLQINEFARHIQLFHQDGSDFRQPVILVVVNSHIHQPLNAFVQFFLVERHIVLFADIDKVLFVVDRKDLDYQTMKEYDRFEKGAANSNTSTAVLKRQLEDDNARIIITTIQKLATFIKKNAGHSVFDKRVVIIFDECHRSQFGDMHQAITKYFKKYNLFGFTGTPIFAVNAGMGKNPTLRTTAQAFGDQLHAYTIVDAINDKNVLPFRVDYIKTMDAEPDIDDKEVWDINREKAFLAPERIRLVTDYILTHFDQKTYRGDKTYTYSVLQNIAEVASAGSKQQIEEIKQKQRVSGFNSIFAVSSVDAAKLYYAEFQRQMAENPQKRLKVAVIYSYGANEEETDGILDEENPEDTSALDQSSRDFLDAAIRDYNGMFHTNYSTDGDKFQNYYKDVSLRMKNKELDLLIVVNMFLTGFDATTLNTLWVDKNLKMHGLIQAYSRTNRILNSIKVFGNIVCFRNLQKRTDDAISLFGDKEAGGIVLMRSYKDYYFGYEDADGKYHPGYQDMIEELTTKFPLTEERITGEQRQKEFIVLFGAILRMRNLLTSFDEFAGSEILSERDFQDYLGRYQDLRDEWKNRKPGGEKEEITDDIVFEIELIKQIEINIDYILLLVQKYHDSHCDDKEVLITIRKAVDASPELRSKKALIETFIAGINDVSDVMLEWRTFVAEEKERQLVAIIQEENLKDDETRRFMESSFRDGSVKTTGTDIDRLMPPISRFGGGNRAEKKQTIIEKLKGFFDRFFGIG